MLLGRAAFWPFRPQYGAEHRHGRGWQRVARSSAAVRAGCWSGAWSPCSPPPSFAPTFDADGIPLSETVRGGTESATGQAALERHFDAGGASPAMIVTPEDSWQAVAEAAAGVDGVASVAPFTGAAARAPGDPVVVDGLVRLDATLADAPDSDAALTPSRTCGRRSAASTPTRSSAATTASNLDTRETAARDLRVIVPSVLLVITLVLALLLRSLVAPLLLVATVALSVGATVGVAALLFEHVLRLPRQRPRHPADRLRVPRRAGDRLQHLPDDPGPRGVGSHGTRDGVLRALAVTGGVITSAGLVLAATFGALAVLPLRAPQRAGVPGRLRRPARHLRRPVAAGAGRRRT